MSHTIFFIDNEPTIVASVEAALSKNGWQCETAGSHDEAVSILEKSSFDVYLIDIELKEKAFGGTELAEDLRWIKDLNYQQGSPIVLMSHHISEAVVVKKTGGRKWMPVYNEYRMPRLDDFDELSDILLEILSHHRANTGAAPNSGSGGLAAQKNVAPSGTAMHSPTVEPAAPPASTDPRALLLALREDFELVRTRVQALGEEARKLVTPITTAPVPSIEARMALNEAVNGAEMAAELLKRAADSLAKLGESMSPP